jgi:hypothetical protein
MVKSQQKLCAKIVLSVFSCNNVNRGRGWRCILFVLNYKDYFLKTVLSRGFVRLFAPPPPPPQPFYTLKKQILSGLKIDNRFSERVIKRWRETESAGER